MSKFPVLFTCTFSRSGFFTYLGCPPSRSFTLFVPCSCCLGPRSLMPIMHSGPFHSPFPDVYPAAVPLSMLSLAQFFLGILLRRATLARNVVPLLAKPNLSWGPHLFWVKFLRVFYHKSCHCCTAGYLPAGGSQLHPGYTVSRGPRFSEDVSLEPCHCCMAGPLPVGLCFPCHICTVVRPSADYGRLSLGSKNCPRQILRFLAAALRGQFSLPGPFLLRFSDRDHFGVFCGDYLCHLGFRCH